MAATSAPAQRDALVTMTTWPSLTETRGRTKQVTWTELVAHLRAARPRPAVTAHPDLPGWSPARFREGHRRLDCVELVTALVLDVDKGGLSIDRLRAAFAGGAVVLHTTRSSTPASPRWRVVVRLSRGLLVAEHAAVLAVVRAELAASGVPIDDNAKDASRLWYASCEPAAGAFVCEVLEGEPLNVDQLLAVTAKKAPPAPEKGPEPVPRPPLRVVTVNDAETRARLYARRIDPAVSGQGGHTKTFEAAQKIHRGFDLDAETAFRVLAAEWNPACSPPWRERDLRRKVAEAGEKGAMAWGALLQEQRHHEASSGAPKSGPAPAGAHRDTNPDDGAPPPPPDEDARPVIKTGPDFHTVADEAIQALRRDPAIYCRGESLVRVLRADRHLGSADVQRPEGAPVIRPLPLATLREWMTRAATYERFDTRTRKWSTCPPPEPVVQTVAARGRWPFPELVGLADAPVLRADGTVLQSPGYDVASGYVYTPAMVFPPVPERPTQVDAAKAAAALLEVAQDFPIASAAHRSAWLAFVLTLFARPAIDGPCPMFAVDATTRGSDKGKLVDAAALIAHGRDATKTPQPEDDAAFRKLILSLVDEGEPLAVIDNARSTLAYTSLEAALTATVWKDRVLGTSRTITAPNRLVWGVTGNNLEFGGDLTRRTLHIRLESPLENPEDRTDFAHGDLLAWVRQNRARLVVAALTVLRAYVVAGRPAMGCKTWGSFEAWSALVAPAIVFAGLADPMATRTGLESTGDAKRQAQVALLDGWTRLDPSGAGLTAKTALDVLYPPRRDAGPPDGHDDLREALEVLCKPVPGKPPTSAVLGKQLRGMRRRVIGGRMFDVISTTHGSQRWGVVRGGDDGDRGDF